MSAENDIYSSFLNDLDHEDSADYEISAHTRVNPGKFNAVPGSAAWKAQRSSTQKARADANALRSGSTSALPTSLSREEKREAELCASLRRRRIPTVILTGFLGSGKTTLLNRLLDSTKLRLAVIENEVGAVSVDDKLIETPSSGFSAGAGDGDSRGAGGGAGGLFQPGTQRAKEVVLLPNGCMCCRVRGDLRDAFKRIVKTAYSPQASRSAPEGNPTGTPPPTSQMKRGLDGLVLELSGLSELGPVVQTFFSDTFVQGTLGIDSIVCVIDVSNLKRTLSQGSGLIFEQLSLVRTNYDEYLVALMLHIHRHSLHSSVVNSINVLFRSRGIETFVGTLCIFVCRRTPWFSIKSICSKEMYLEPSTEVSWYVSQRHHLCNVDRFFLSFISGDFLLCSSSLL